MASPVKHAAVKALAATVAALLVVAGLALGVPHGDSGEDDATVDVLLTAAQETETVGSADVEVVGDAHTAVRWDRSEFLSELPTLDGLIDRLDDALPPPSPPLPDGSRSEDSEPGSDDTSSTETRNLDLPEFPAVPDAPELPVIPEPGCQDMPVEICERLRRQIEDARRRLESSLRRGESNPGRFERREGFDDPAFDPEEMRDRIRDELGTRRAEAKEQMRERLAEMEARIRDRLREIPDEFRCDFHFEGAGTMTVHGTVAIGGDAEVSCDPDFVDGSGRFDTVLSQELAFNANGDGTFAAVPRAEFGSFAADGRSIAELLRKAENAEDEGTEEIDGVRVRHVSFSTGEGPVSMQVDVWIGVDDHVVRKIVTRSSAAVNQEGIQAEFEAEHTVLVTNVQLDAPAEEIDVPDFEDVIPAPPAVETLDRLTNPFGDPMPAPYIGSEVSGA